MGNSANSYDQNFLCDWVHVETVKYSENDKNIWAKINDRSLQMQEYTLNVTSKQQLEEEQRIHLMRQNHPQLVSSLHFTDETEEEFCASNYRGKIYIERIPLTLDTITDIPFPDALHIYSQSLQGFHTLTSEVQSGCFPISQQHIGINCENVCKVWLNNKFNRNYPSRNERIMEERMVKTILDTIEDNVDLGSLQGKPSPKDYIYSRAKNPSEVKFSQAINLLRNYANEFFGGIIPSKLSCVDKVGGSFLLSRNWEGSKAQNSQQLSRPIQQQLQRIDFPQNQSPNFYSTALPVNLNSSTYRSNPAVESSPNDYNNYTTFKRQEPVLRPANVWEGYQGNNFTNQRGGSFAETPNFKAANLQSSRTNLEKSLVNQPIFQQSTVQQVQHTFIQQGSILPTSTQNNRIIPQIVHNNANGNSVSIVSEMRRSTMINSTQLNGSNVRFVNDMSSPRAEVRQQLINRRVEQITSEKGILIIPKQPISQLTPRQLSQFAPMQVNRQVVKQSGIQGTSIVVPLNSFTPQNQQHVQQVGRQQGTSAKKRSIIFVNSGQSTQIPTQTQQSYAIHQVPKQVVANPGLIESSELEKVNSKLVFIDKFQAPTFKASGADKIQNLTNQNNTNTSNTQETNGFSNTQGANGSSQQTDYSSSYYAFTNKLYDKEDSDNNFNKGIPFQPIKSPTKTSPNNFDNMYVASTKPTFESKEYQSPINDNKFKVSLDDGMSSAAFLQQLKNMKFSTNFNNKATENTFDYNFKPSSEPLSYLSNFSANKTSVNGSTNHESFYKNGQQNYQMKAKTQNNNLNQQEEGAYYKVDIENYTTTLSDGQHHQNDLVIVGQKINMVPLNSNNQLNQDDQNEQIITYEYQQGETPSGNLHYESEVVKVQNENGVYEEQYYEEQESNGQFQTVFDKYASYSQNNYTQNQQANQQVNRYKAVEESQRTVNNVQDTQQFYAVNSKSFRSNNFVGQQFEPGQQEEYKVEFDPEILADLQRLKGGN